MFHYFANPPQFLRRIFFHSVQWVSHLWPQYFTLFLFYKNHVFQNEAGLFLIFSKIWGSIVLNLFLNYILKNDNEKINRKYHFYILFSQKLYSSSNIEGSIILLFPLLIQFLHFFLNFLLFFFLKFEARCS